MIGLAKEQLRPVAPLADNNDFGYQRFSLLNNNGELFQGLEDKGVDAILRDGYFILQNTSLGKEQLSVVSGEYCYSLSKSACKFINCELLNKHHLAIGCYTSLLDPVHSNQDYHAYFTNFKNKALDIQFYWTSEFLNSVYIYLKNRKSAKHTLINKEIIQTMLADILVHLKSAAQYRDYSDSTSDDLAAEKQLLAVKELKAANQLLAKLYGGRSFLAGNVIEMIMIFEYFRDIYFN